jgi:hypothetical protein
MNMTRDNRHSTIISIYQIENFVANKQSISEGVITFTSLTAKLGNSSPFFNEANVG